MNKKILNLLVIVTVLAIFIPFNVNAKTMICTSYKMQKTTVYLYSEKWNHDYPLCDWPVAYNYNGYNFCYVKSGNKYTIYHANKVAYKTETTTDEHYNDDRQAYCVDQEEDQLYNCLIIKDKTKCINSGCKWTGNICTNSPTSSQSPSTTTTKTTTKTTTTTTTANNGGFNNVLPKEVPTGDGTCKIIPDSNNFARCLYVSDGEEFEDLYSAGLNVSSICARNGNKCTTVRKRIAATDGYWHCLDAIYSKNGKTTDLRYYHKGDYVSGLCYWGTMKCPIIRDGKCFDEVAKLTFQATYPWNKDTYSNISSCYASVADNGFCHLNEARYLQTNDSYIFTGWSLSPDMTNCLSDDSIVDYFFNDYAYACWEKVDDDNKEITTTTTTTTVKQTTTIPTSYVTTPEKQKQESINAYRYVMDDAFYQGENVSCSDKVYVTKCDDTYCEVTSINGVNTNTTTKVYKNKISTTDTINSCSNKTRYVKENGYSYSDKALSKDAKEISCGSEIKLIKSLGDACQDNVCEVSINNEKVFVKEDIIVTTKPTCSNTQATSNNLTGFKGTTVVQITYEKDKDELIEQSNLEEAVTCADGFNKSYYMVSDSDTCKDIESGTCSKNYQVSCIPKLKPKVSGTGSTVRSNGYGTINFSAVDVNNVGIKGYYISSADTPTINSEWTAFRDSTYSASADLLAGTYFIWVIDNNNTISYSLMVRVIDTDSSNSLSSLSVKSVNGTDYTMKSMDSGSGEVAFVDKTLNYVRLSNELKSDSTLAGFESLATGYEVTVKENKIAVYATLTSADASYVEGFEPRTVDLDYGRNVILIKIMNKQGKVRTYTIIANRVDDRQSNNLISDIKLSKGKIEFDPYTSNYEVTIPKNTKEVEISATLDSAGSKFVSGYTPGKVTINDDETSKVIKVISEAGIVRSYVITFVKSGAKLDTSTKNSVYLSSLSVPGTGLEFDKETNSYTVSVGYEVQELPVNAYAESKNAKVDIIGNYNFKVGTNAIEVLVTNGSKARVYTIYVIRKQDGLTIDEDTALSTLTVKGYNIGFKPDIFDYAVKIKREKSLIITATPLSNRSEVYMYGNNDLTGFSTVRVKVIAENGNTSLYSIDIQKDAFNEKLEKILTISAVGVAIIGGVVIFIKNRKRKMREYLGE